jgi:hypothetical protein
MAPDEAEAILGRAVTDPAGKDLGHLVDVLVDSAGQPQAAVIDFGGFLGVGSRKVAVHWSTLRFNPADGKHKITLDMTPDQIKAAPEFTNSDRPAPVVTPATVTQATAVPPAAAPPAAAPAAAPPAAAPAPPAPAGAEPPATAAPPSH